MTAPIDLAAYLEARWAEDESAAQSANTDESRRPWGDPTIPPVAPEQWGELVDGYLGGAVGAHCATWSPARVLAEVEAKRAILALHAQIECVNCEDAGRHPSTSCRTCHHGGDGDPERYDGTCGTTLALAQPYASRDDFPAEWRQETLHAE